MADLRAANSFEMAVKPGESHTYAHDDTIVYDSTKPNGSVSVGLAVSVESSNVVTLAGSGENVIGKLLKVESDGFCTVQDHGYMTLPGGASATLTAGLKIVGDLGGESTSAEGYIQAVSTEHTVSRGVIVDSSVATAVVVYMD